jgi:WD40 repeat protein
MRFWSLAAAHDGIFAAETKSEDKPGSDGKRLEYLHLVRRSFADDAVSEISCQWPKADGSNDAFPWGLAVTPDGKMIAVLWQENSGGGNIDAEYFRKAVLIYHLDSTPDGEGRLIPKRTIWLDKYKGLNGRSNRGICLSPDAQAFAFFVGNGDATIYRVDDGKTVAEVQTGPNICSSADGSLFAGGSFRERLPVRVWRTGSGAPVFATPISGEIATVAITPDNQKLYVGWNTGVLECFDLASGKSVSKVNSKIAPLAISPSGDRFVGFLPANNTKGNVNGSCVLGSLSNGQTILVLNEGAHVLNRAYFSPTGNVVAFMKSRDSAGMARSLTIDEAARQLEQFTPFVSSMAPSNAMPMAK